MEELCVNPLMRLLLVEDNPGDALLLHELLIDNPDPAAPMVQITVAEDLKTALSRLDRWRFDVAAVDLNLPDSCNLETFIQMRNHSPDLAIVVLTGLEDETLGIEAIRHGAQDYLVKGRLDGLLLSRALRYATERQRLMNELERLRFVQRQQLEMSQLAYYSSDLPDESGRVFALLPVYGTLVRRYVLATRERQPKPSEEVQSLALRMAAMGLGAREVVRLHLKVLKDTGNWSTYAEERAFSVDARLALLELMGHLTDLYRERAMDQGKAS
jgi:CheY-like chemotaxis protein